MATLLPTSLWAAAQQDNGNPAHAEAGVYELRVYHAAPGKLSDLLSRFREHTIKIFDRHGIKSVAYWTPLDEPEKSNTLIYILQHPSREAAAANWKSFQDDPEWKSVKEKSEANGKLVEKVDSTYMALTDFSPRLRLDGPTVSFSGNCYEIAISLALWVVGLIERASWGAQKMPRRAGRVNGQGLFGISVWGRLPER